LQQCDSTSLSRAIQWNQKEKATLFRTLHKCGDPVVLANAWDAGSARVIEEAGGKAIATTPSIADMACAGVARGQRGFRTFSCCVHKAKQAAEEVLQSGTYSGFTEEAIQYQDFNRLFEALFTLERR